MHELCRSGAFGSRAGSGWLFLPARGCLIWLSRSMAMRPLSHHLLSQWEHVLEGGRFSSGIAGSDRKPLIAEIRVARYEPARIQSRGVQ